MKINNEWANEVKEAVRVVLAIIVSFMLIVALVIGLIQISEWARVAIRLRGTNTLETDSVMPDSGVGRVMETITFPVYGYKGADEEGHTILRVWCETDDPLPYWWDPEAADIVWMDSEAVSEDVGVSNKGVPEITPNAAPVDSKPRDIGCPDWNLNTSLVGWDGRLCEVWEMDLFSRIFYKEFWGTSETCCEAGCDAMLRLWESGIYGNTLGEVLSAVNDSGVYIYSTYPSVWETEYDPDGLSWCRSFCEKRFYEGPSWEAMYFRTKWYHDIRWAIPAYNIDNVYFSFRKW